MKTSHRMSTVPSTLSRASFHLRVSKVTRLGSPRPLGGTRTLCATFSATLAALLLAILPGNAASQVVAWGDNAHGQTTVPAAAQSGVTAISAGNGHTVGLKSDGSVIAWGFNGHGQTTVPVGALSGVTAISAGYFHTVALKNDGGVIAWGDNGLGQTTVPAAAQSGVTAISGGAYYTVALKSDGSVIAWGDNADGQTTVPAGAQSGVTAIAAGVFHTAALKSDGSVVAWGNNGSGQTTVPAGAQSGVTAIAVGDFHTVALKSDGSVFAWGSNGFGETTVPAGALSGVTAISAALRQTVALKSDGSVLAWGHNGFGQTTVPPVALSGVTAIDAGVTHTVALVPPTTGPVPTVVFHGATGGATPSPGDAVPGEPVGTTFKTFGISTINGTGTVAFLADIKAGTVTTKVIFDGTAVVARYAAATPITGTTFASFKDPALNSEGEVAFLAGLAGSVATLDKAALFTNDGGTLATVVRTDDALPGLGGARLKTISAFQLLDDAVLFSGLLQSKTAGVAPGPGGATTADDFILCRWTTATGVELLLREGASLGGKTVKTIATLLPASGSAGHGRKGNPSASGLARVGFTNGTQAQIEIAPSGASLIAETGGTLTNPAGGQWKTYGLPATNLSGGAAFLATLATGPGGVSSANAIGLFADTTAGSLAPVARKGDTVGGLTLTAFTDPVFNDDSAVASLVTLGGAVTSTTNKAILLVPDVGAATLIARTGGEPAGVAGAKWKTFTSLALPDGLGPVFTATMVSGANGTAGPGGVTTAADTGLWAQDSNGVLQLLVREGVTVIGGKTLKSFTVLGIVPGSPGQTRAFNAAKQLTFRATLIDNSQSVVTVQMP